MSTLRDIAIIIAERNDLPHNDAEEFVKTFFEMLKDSLVEEEQVKIKGLGTFKRQKMRERTSVNINTGEKEVIDSHDRITFTPDKTMAESVNKPFSCFETVILNEGVNFEETESENEESPEPAEPNVKEDFTPEPAKPIIKVVERQSEMNNTEEKVVEPVAAQPVEETAAAPETKSTPEVVVEDAVQDDDDNTSTAKVLMYIFCAFVIFVAGFAIGRATSDLQFADITEALGIQSAKEEPQTSKPVAEKEKPAAAPKPAAKTPAAKTPAETNSTAPKAADAPQTTASQPTAPQTKPAEEAFDSHKYDSDARIRTGAYRIVGVKETIKAGKGQTLASIAKTYLGPGMECYVEAINGYKEVTEGQKVLIPDLKIKKKRK